MLEFTSANLGTKMRTVESLTIPEQAKHHLLTLELKCTNNTIQALEFRTNMFNEDNTGLIQWYKNDKIKIEGKINNLVNQ